MDELAERVASVPSTDLLPERLRGELPGLPDHLTLVAATDLPGSAAVIAVLEGAQRARFAAPLVTDGRSSVVRRVAPGEGATTAAAAAVARGVPIEGHGFTTTQLLTGGSVDLSGLHERPMLVDQTHESVVVGEHVVVKWAVHAEPTPATVLVPHLVATGFSRMPRPWGFVTWQDASDPQAPPVLVASVMDFLPDASDGWTWAVSDVGEVARGSVGPDPSLDAMGALGELVADLHAAMATPSPVIPAPRADADADEVSQWRQLAEDLLGQAAGTVGGPEGERLRARRHRMLDIFDTLGAVGATPVIPVHGDLHVGQVLRWRGGYAVGDFDGNPVLPVSERLRPQPAARDVAGMVQSIDHVGRVVLRRVEGADASLVEQWIPRAQQRFLASYGDRLRHRGHGDLLDERLLLAFRVEQECREFLYAERHLPRWRYVPDQALQALLPAG